MKKEEWERLVATAKSKGFDSVNAMIRWEAHQLAKKIVKK